MHEITIPDEIQTRYLPRDRKVTLLLAGLAAVGVLAFLALLATDAHRAWTSYVSNWLFFTSVAQGAILLCAATTITKAKWNWSVRRLSLAMGAFLPISFLLLLPMLLFLRGNYFPWIAKMEYDVIVQAKAAYLNIPFLVIRNLIAAGVLFGLSLLYIRLALRPDLGPERAAEEQGDTGRARWRQRLSGGWRGQEVEARESSSRLTVLSPALVLVYALAMSIFAVDWAMSLDAHWFSTLFPAWFFMGAFWGGILATALLSVVVRRWDGYAHEHIGAQQHHDLGKLSFGFSIFWTYLFWSQYIVIWYGKLPWEQAWMIDRAGADWGPISLLVIILCFVTPFGGLISKTPKLIPTALGTITALALTGLWLERFLLVAPSIHVEGTPTITFWEPLIGLGFLGIFASVVRWFLSTFPIVQLWQPTPAIEMMEAEIHPPQSARAHH